MLRSLLPCLAFAALLVVGCGGGGSVPSPNLAPTASPTPANIPVGPTPSSVTLTGGGFSLSFLVPSVLAGSIGSITAQLQATLPPGVVAPTDLARRPSTVRKPTTLGAVQAMIYLTVTPSANVTFSSLPGFTYTLPASNLVPAGSSAYAEFYDPATSTWLPALGPGVLSGQTVTFPSVAGSVALKGGSTYLYALVRTVSTTPSPGPTATPTAPPPGPTPTPTSAAFATCSSTGGATFPLVIQNKTGIGSSSPITVYAYGTNASSQMVYLSDAVSGNTTAIPAAGQQIPSFTAASNSCINLPPLISARVYMVLAGQTINLQVVGNSSGVLGVSAPDPWSVSRAGNSSTVNNIWDFLEYTWTGGSSAFNIDTTQVDALGIPVSFQAVNTAGGPSGSIFGMQRNAVTNLTNDLNSLGYPWSGLIQNTGTPGVVRVISPQHAVNIPADGAAATPPPPPANAPTFNANYFDNIISQVWSPLAYPATSPLYLSYSSAVPSGTYGYVDSSNNFDFFYGGVQVAQIAKPTTWAVLNNAGAFVSASGSSGSNAINIGRALVVGIERGTLPNASPYGPSVPQPFCGPTDAQYFYGGATTAGGTIPMSSVTTNWYAALMHKFGNAGLAYAFPDDDECQGPVSGLYDPDTSATYSPGQQWNVTLNPL